METSCRPQGIGWDFSRPYKVFLFSRKAGDYSNADAFSGMRSTCGLAGSQTAAPPPQSLWSVGLRWAGESVSQTGSLVVQTLQGAPSQNRCPKGDLRERLRSHSGLWFYRTSQVNNPLEAADFLGNCEQNERGLTTESSYSGAPEPVATSRTKVSGDVILSKKILGSLEDEL